MGRMLMREGWFMHMAGSLCRRWAPSMGPLNAICYPLAASRPGWTGSGSGQLPWPVGKVAHGMRVGIWIPRKEGGTGAEAPVPGRILKREDVL